LAALFTIDFEGREDCHISASELFLCHHAAHLTEMHPYVAENVFYHSALVSLIWKLDRNWAK
jgi:hypothetical protein